MATRCNNFGVVSGTRANGLLHLKNGVDYINPGEEDQMEIYGYVICITSSIHKWILFENLAVHLIFAYYCYSYRRNHARTVIIWFLIVITGGLLRLIFHWVPHLMLQATHIKCSLEEAETVLLIEKFQGKHTSYYVKKLRNVTAKEVMLVMYQTR